MKKEVYLTILFDYYGDLLTEKQKIYFTNYYFDNLTLAEIADNLNISRNAVHKQLKSTEEKLNRFEKVIGLYIKDETLRKIVNDVKEEKIKERLEELLK